jgi:hypothetical protein
LSPVPLAVQTAWLSSSKTGTLSAVTLVAAVTHCAVTQNGGGTGSVERLQAATTWVVDWLTIGCPETVTWGDVWVGVA